MWCQSDIATDSPVKLVLSPSSRSTVSRVRQFAIRGNLWCSFLLGAAGLVAVFGINSHPCPKQRDGSVSPHRGQFHSCSPHCKTRWCVYQLSRSSDRLSSTMTQQINTTPPRMRSRATGARVTEEEVNREDSFDREEHQSAWEDEGADILHLRHSRTASPSGSSLIRSPRKRRRPPLVTKGSKKQVSTKSTTTIKSSQVTTQPDEVPTIAREDLVNGLLHGSLFTSKYALDVFKRALRLLRYPLSFLFFLYLLGFIINKMEQTLRSIFSPICIVPGISRTRLCHTPVPPFGGRPVKWADYPHLVDVESKTFEQLMDGVVGGSALSLEVKQVEMATADLVTLVRISDLKAKDALATSLVEFIETAKKTGRGLQRMSSKVGGTVDRFVLKIDLRSNVLLIEQIVSWQPTSTP